MTAISVDVTINSDGSVTYKSSSSWVSSDGQIDIPAGDDATITFMPSDGSRWEFVDPWCTIDPTGGDVTVTTSECSGSQVVLQDNNPQGPASSYTYCLETSEKALDPRIINKGT